MAFRLTVNLGNSIIGVSILTMPYCFRRCGILLSIVSIVASGLLNRAGCHLLFRSAVLTRKRSFEDIALQVLGPVGKLAVELCVLAFLLGTCVAYFVVIGDLGPSIVSDVTGFQNSPHLRAFTMTFIGMFIALPLGLLRRVDSLTSFSALSFVVYLLLAARLFSQTSLSLMTGETESSSVRFVWWDASHLLENMPIFAMSLSCQTQLFELFDHSFLNFEDYDVVPKLNRVVRRAVHLCSVVYVSIGVFGYVAFHDVSFGGNILSFLPASIISTAMKVAFVATVAVSLPLCLFPCRTSLFSLLIKSNRDSSRSSLMNEFVLSPTSGHHMSDKHFRFLTVVLIVFTVSISVMVPRIEFVLSIIGSTTGTIICFILPGHVYSRLTRKNTTERVLARFVTVVGVFILIICTLASLTSFSQSAATDDVLLSANDLSVDRIIPVIPLPSKAPDAASKQAVDPNPLMNDSQLKNKQEELLRKLEKNQEEQKQLIEEQKKVLQEFKKHEKHEERIHSQTAKSSIASHAPNRTDSESVPESGAKNASLDKSVETPRKQTGDDLDTKSKSRSVKEKEKESSNDVASVRVHYNKSDKISDMKESKAEKSEERKKRLKEDASAVKDF